MKILVTGGTGFIGKEISKLLAAKNHNIYIVSRKGPDAKMDLPFPCEVIPKSDISKFSFDAVIHLAGEPVAQKWDEKIKNKIETSRTSGTIEIIDELSKSKDKPKIFLAASAIGFYGNRDNEELTEDSIKGVGFLPEVCEKWEASSFTAHNKLGARTAVFRIGIVLGLGSGALHEMMEPFRLGVGGAIGNGNQWMSWIHVQDLARIFVWALENPSAQGIYNAVSTDPKTNYEFSKTLAQSMGGKLGPNVPEFVLKTKYGEMSQIILSSIKITPKKLLDQNFKFHFSKLENALDDLIHGAKGFENIYVFEQWVPKPIQDIFPYYENADNLQNLTPPWLDFKVLGKSTPNMQGGTLINYKLKLYGIPINWQSRIEVWNPPNKFVDVQIKGPYKKWHHTHEFETLGRGTLIRDRVIFSVPMGILGYLTSGWKVKSDILKIFEYRKKIIYKMFH